MTRVFPLPAPARTRSGPSVWSTASRCAGLSPSRTPGGATSLTRRSPPRRPPPAAAQQPLPEAEQQGEAHPRAGQHQELAADGLPDGPVLDGVAGGSREEGLQGAALPDAEEPPGGGHRAPPGADR